MKRRAIAAALAVMLTLGVTWAPVRADQSRSFNYVGTNAGGVLFSARDTPVGGVAPGGFVDLVPTGSTITAYIDDRAALGGQAVPVYVSTARTSIFSGCLPVRTSVTFQGTHSGQDVRILLGSNYDRSCSATPTVGLLTVHF